MAGKPVKGVTHGFLGFGTTTKFLDDIRSVGTAQRVFFDAVGGPHLGAVGGGIFAA